MEEQVKDLLKRVAFLEQKRIDQMDIKPKAVKKRHIEDMVLVFGLDADLPDDDNTGISVFFATDTNKLYCYNGTAWVSVTLT